MKVSLLVGGGGDIYYEVGLLSGLISKGVEVDYIGSDSVKNMPIMNNENVHFYNLRGSQATEAPVMEKIIRILKYYLRLLVYAAKTDSKIFHIQWLNKFVHFDRTLLVLYYRMFGKRLVFTAHNVNAGVRDERDSWLNRLSLGFMYRRVDHVIVHTNEMKRQLIEAFGISGDRVSVIPYGINDMVAKSEMTREEARRKLNLEENEKVALFFGLITPYKGLEYPVMALANQKGSNGLWRLIIAGKVDKGQQKYWDDIQGLIGKHNLRDRVIEKIAYIPDGDVEIYFKAADLLVLPYKYIFQSGVLFLAFYFGLPVLATDVGSLKEFVIEGKTGFICRPGDPDDLADKMNTYFKSDLFINLETRRQEIISFATHEYSWGKIAEKTCAVYRNLT